MLANVLLLNAVDIPSSVSGVMPDNGLALLAACLRDAGHTVEIWDPGTATTLRDSLSFEYRERLSWLLKKRREASLDAQESLELIVLDGMRDLGLRRIYRRLEEKLLEEMRSHRFDVLGFKLWFGPGLDESLQLAERVCRLHPGLQVYVGGPMATLAPELVMRKAPVIRGVCLGDGEEAIVAIADAAARGAEPHGVPNLWLRSCDRGTVTRNFRSLSDLPPPCYSRDVYRAMNGDEKIPVFYVEDSRGCPRHCSFCGHSLFTGPGRRVRATQRVVDEMDDHCREFGSHAFRLTGSSTAEEQYRGLADLLLARGRSYLYSGFAHVENWSDTDLGALRRSGLSALFVGIESGSEAILRVMGKRLDRQRLSKRIRACLDLGIFVCGSVIFPAPGDTSETEEATIALLCELFEGTSHCAVPIQPAFPQPGSSWGDDMARYGFSGDREGILDDMARRRVSRLVPPHLAKPLPYKLDGMTFEQLGHRSLEFGRKLRARGISTGISDELVLVALAADETPHDFERENDEIFSLADSDRLTGLIQRIRTPRIGVKEALL